MCQIKLLNNSRQLNSMTLQKVNLSIVNANMRSILDSSVENAKTRDWVAERGGFDPSLAHYSARRKASMLERIFAVILLFFRSLGSCARAGSRRTRCDVCKQRQLLFLEARIVTRDASFSRQLVISCSPSVFFAELWLNFYERVKCPLHHRAQFRCLALSRHFAIVQ